MSRPNITKRFTMELTDEQHATLKRRAEAADLSIHAYLLAMCVDGKLPKNKDKKQKHGIH